MVTRSTTSKCEPLVRPGQCGEQRGQVHDGEPGYRPQAVSPSVPFKRVIEEPVGGVGAECGDHAQWTPLMSLSDASMGIEVVSWPIGGGERPYVEVRQQRLRRPIRELPVRLFPDLPRGCRTQDEIDAEHPPELQVGPDEQRVADEAWDSCRPSRELVPRVDVTPRLWPVTMP